MLDLDILLNCYASLSHIPAVKACNVSDPRTDLVTFYTKQLSVKLGEAGYFITDEFLFCGKIVQKGTGIAVLIGPVSDNPLSKDAISRIIKEMDLHKQDARDIQSRLNALPLIPLTEFLQSLSFLNYIINENSSLLPRYFSLKPPLRTASRLHSAPVFHNTAQYEIGLMQCIEHGRVDLVKLMLEEGSRSSMNMGLVSNDSLKTLKAIFISSTAMSSRAAVKGGLNYDHAMSLSDLYLQRTDSINRFDDFSRLWSQMVLDLTTRVADLRLHSSCSDLVRGAARSINGKLYSKITVEQLANELHVSSSHLSHQFKRETGQTLTEYIAQQKIDEAKRLMQTTDLSLAQITYQLAFSSQSYFHAIFKKVTGISPGKFPRER